MKTLAEQLAEYAVGLKFEGLPAPVVHEGKRRVIDSMGCALGACGACITKVLTDDGRDWRYSRICMEGPTYDEKCLVLE